MKVSDASFGEKSAAMLVTGAMNLKSKLGMGLKQTRKNHTGSNRKQKTRHSHDSKRKYEKGEVRRKYKKEGVKRKVRKKKIHLSAIIKAGRNLMEVGS